MRVLVVVDAQYDFVDGALGSVNAQAVIPHMKERIKDYAGESFSFEEFVANDSREIGEFTRSSSADEASEVVIHNPSPKIIKGSVLDNIKTE